MDLDASKEVCGTCANWQGKRARDEDGTCRVSPSAKGLCQRLKKPKPPHGGCDDWTQIEEVEHG